jgi:hypothetical protein
MVQIQPVSGAVLNGTLIGINSYGAIIIKDAAGVNRSFLAGDVHLRPVQESID